MWSIRSRLIKMIMEASKDSYPMEFGALLKAEHEVIYEIAILPGTIQGDHHTIMWMGNKPIDFTIVGSVHSHPSGAIRPSDADLHMFSNTGPVHMIVGYPYRDSDYKFFNRKGDEIQVGILGGNQLK
jgi:proteasome lid subunit RPN8/RPN11